ncbi:hypothetical protein NORO109296_09870 [Nocardiopsis rhodophaea]
MMFSVDPLLRNRALLPLRPAPARGQHPVLGLDDAGGYSYSTLTAEVTEWLGQNRVMTVVCGDEHGRGLLSSAAWVAGERLSCSVRSRCHGWNMTIWVE